MRSDKVIKKGVHDFDRHDSRETHSHDRVHSSLVSKSKTKNLETDNFVFKNYVTKQSLLQSRMSSVETDVPSTQYRSLISARKPQPNLNNYNQPENSLSAHNSSHVTNFTNNHSNYNSVNTNYNQNYNTNYSSNLNNNYSGSNDKVLESSATLKGNYSTGTGAKYRPLKSTTLKKERPTIKPPQSDIKWELGERYKFVDMVGSGSYGHVCRAYDSQLNKFVAIKRIHKVFDDLIDCKRILREIAILNRLDHPNVVKILDILVPDNLETFDVLYVVLEIAASDIKQLVRSPAFLNENHIRLLVFNLLSGVHYLHSVGIYHRDLKPANCLINRDCSVKICDFGLARTTTFPEEFMESGSYSGREADVSYTSRPVESISTSYSTSRSLPDYAYCLGSSDRFSSDTASGNVSVNHFTSIATSKGPMRQVYRRQLTGHVVTRWYRAPELILLQENYSFAVDIWSVGCIFAELLNMMKVNVSDPCDRSPLFPGSSCFPLSPDNKNANPRTTRENDQLNLIFNVLGTPSEEDINCIQKADVRRYVKFFAKRGFQDLRTKFKGASLESIDLLKKMLTFNPEKRISVFEALNHPYFKSISKPRSNFDSIPKVTLPFNDWVNMSESQLRYSFLREIQRYHKDFKIPVKIIYRS
ncbi:Map2 kinase, putative [Theileria annulata]|uniref:Mitogen-activated protein kinase n=1 Tax=Theileria annulata TaxID=5874 RepID=Q4UGU0_THEAN|nr:Map2 kinase, putative [Theileria annulata]CAI73699.1 Map2 kinase, putative [Theileria annulata]|eukprot:XP_954376.1 Map2 kinase, putative [Theileria annulata]